ncbi:MAG: glycoside hydrolase family 3 protein [Gammaproteobacteria bacterium]|nr:glycoside hydrolase family 3 protein [Gammaproteobacteria bacterium]
MKVGDLVKIDGWDKDNHKIPVIWGTDAVHGHNNLRGATLFPHNIALGSTRNEDLVKSIGKATAIEVLASGLDLTFSPAISVPRDDRWGRTYEGYSEDPAIVSLLGVAMVEGLQGNLNSTFMSNETILATAKHYIGDGGTERGIDKGNTILSEDQLIAIHGEGYRETIKAGVQVIMASFNSWNGEKMHGNEYLLTDVLKNKMGFDGIVLGDWNGHMEVSGCSVDNCPKAINAGIDMFMVTDAWQQLYTNTLEQVNSGVIKIERLDDAVKRIIRVKLRSNLLDKGLPSKRKYSGNESIIGSKLHRNIARKAVRESLVLLKNNDNILPLNPSSKILVLGEAANDLKQATGGWSLTWQGNENENKDFPGATTILKGIKDTVRKSGGSLEYSKDGFYKINPDVAIIVIGENPYAEYKGTLSELVFSLDDLRHLEWAESLRKKNIPVITIFLSGRPLWINRELNRSDAFIAAWLPGSEGHGISEVIFKSKEIEKDYDFIGKLAYSWPSSIEQSPLNYDDTNYSPLFELGYGLNYSNTINIEQLNENINRKNDSLIGLTLLEGWAQEPYSVELRSLSGRKLMDNKSVATPSNEVSISVVDKLAQEDSQKITFFGNTLSSWNLMSNKKMDWSQVAKQSGVLVINIRPLKNDSNEILYLGSSCGDNCEAILPLGELLNGFTIGEWSTIGIDLKCFEKNGLNLSEVFTPLFFSTQGRWSFEIGSVFIDAGTGGKKMLFCPNIE